MPCWPQAQPAAAAKKVNSYQASRAAEAEFERIIKERSGGKLPSLELRSSTAVRRPFNRSSMLWLQAVIPSGTSSAEQPAVVPQGKDDASKPEKVAGEAVQAAGSDVERQLQGGEPVQTIKLLRPVRETTVERLPRVPVPQPPSTPAGTEGGGVVSMPGGDTPARADQELLHALLQAPWHLC